MANNIYELDFTGVESTNLIPEGTHTARISGAEFKKAKTGSDQLQVNWETAEGATRSSWYSLVPQALWKLKGVLEAIGVPCEGKIKLNTATLKGKTASITVEPDPNDSTKLIISRVTRIASSAPDQNSAYCAPTPTPAAMPETPVQAPQAPGAVPPWANPTPAPQQAPASPAVAPTTAPAPQEAQAPAPSSPSNPPQGNLPPWMQAGMTGGSVPPWMQGQK